MTLLEQIRSHSKQMKSSEKGMVQISKDSLRQLRLAAAQYEIAMGRLTDFAIEKLLSEINAEQSKTA